MRDVISTDLISPPNTPVNIAYLGNETSEERLEAARLLKLNGFAPVPIIAARRIGSKDQLFSFTEQLLRLADPHQFMVVGGDPVLASGPFATASDLLTSGWIEHFGIKNVTLPGFPEGNSACANVDPLESLRSKISLLENNGCSVDITTQLSFGAEKIASWITGLRSHSVHNSIRIGIPGPVEAARITRLASLFQVPDAKLENAVRSVDGRLDFTPLYRAISDKLHLDGSENLGIHLYPFGGAGASVGWLRAAAI